MPLQTDKASISRSEVRQASLITGLVWGFAEGLYSIPAILLDPNFDLYVAWTLGLHTLLGFVFSAPVYLAVRLAWPVGGFKRILIIAASTAAAAMMVVFVDLALSSFLAEASGTTRTLPDPMFRIGTNFGAFLWMYALLAAIFSILEINRDVRDRDVALATAQARAQEALAEAVAARLSALRYQLNPHFLFNTLNAISSLIVTGRPVDADAMLARLAEFLRATLTKDTVEATVDDELAMLQTYLDVEAIRFGDRLRIGFNCPPDLRTARLPSFLLQPLVENAMKHAVAPSAGPVSVTVEVGRAEDRLVIAIENDGGRATVPEGGRAAPSRPGLGLQNVRQRLAVRYGPDAASLEAAPTASGFVARVTLPLSFDATELEAAA